MVNHKVPNNVGGMPFPVFVTNVPNALRRYVSFMIGWMVYMQSTYKGDLVYSEEYQF